MLRPLIAGALVALSVGAWSRARQDPDACKLLSPVEAVALVGSPLPSGQHEANATFATCGYMGPNPMELIPNVEISYGAWPDVATAHTRYMYHVQPGSKPLSNTTYTPVANLGDEATIKRAPSLQVCSIEVRSGTAVVSIGVMPVVSDSALKAAAIRALSRLP